MPTSPPTQKSVAEGHGYNKAQPEDQLPCVVLQDHRRLKKKSVAEGHRYKKAQPEDQLPNAVLQVHRCLK